MSNIHILLKDNDNILEITGLVNELTGAFLNAAAVTVTLKDSAGVNVTGDTWPKTLTYVAASNGTYRATLGFNLGLTTGQRYTAAVIADGGAGLRATWAVDCVTRART